MESWKHYEMFTFHHYEMLNICIDEPASWCICLELFLCIVILQVISYYSIPPDIYFNKFHWIMKTFRNVHVISLWDVIYKYKEARTSVLQFRSTHSGENYFHSAKTIYDGQKLFPPGENSFLRLGKTIYAVSKIFPPCENLFPRAKTFSTGQKLFNVSYLRRAKTICVLYYLWANSFPAQWKLFPPGENYLGSAKINSTVRKVFPTGENYFFPGKTFRARRK